jgi:hypothetical protein
MTFKFRALAAASIATLGVAGVANAITPAYEYTSTGSFNDSRPFTLGFEFSLSAPVTINALGYTTDGFTSDQQVGIWDSSGALVTSTTVATTDPVTGHFAYAAIGDVTLAAGTYTIGGAYDGGPFPADATGVTTIPQFTYITDEQTLGSGLNEPTESTGGTYGPNGITQVDFSVAVPEPETWALMLLGLGAVGVATRVGRRSRAIAAA